MNRSLVSSSKYSPGNMAVETLEALFVARGELLRATLSDISDSLTSGSSRFVLLVGPRGAGKTHFTALLHNSIADLPDFQSVRESATVVYFNEEEWGIASYLDFLVRILVILKEQGTEPELATEISSIQKLFSESETRATAQAEQILKSLLGGKRLILICENFHDLLEGLGLKGQRQWRSLIQQSSCWIVFATTPRLSADIQSQKAPFYGQFSIRYLERFEFEDAVKLLVRKAHVDGKEDLAQFLLTPTGRARVRAIHHLAGGNPRVYVVLSEFLSRESLDDLFTPFMQMADDLTPYYQDRLRQLAPRQRKIVEYLSRRGHPEKIKDLAEASMMSQQTASKQIHELAKQGYVVRISAGRSTYVELAEPLMRICIEIKDNRTKQLRLFVEFLRHWYSSREIRSKCSRIKAGLLESERLTYLHLAAAANECDTFHVDPFLDALDDEGWECFNSDDYRGLAEVKTKLIEERGYEEDFALGAFALRESGDAQSAKRIVSDGIKKFPNSGKLRYENAMTLFEASEFDAALCAIDEAISLSKNRISYLCLRGEILIQLQRFEDVIRNEDEQLQLEPSHSHSYLQKSIAYEEIGRLNDALMCAQLLVDHEPDKSLALTRLSYCLQLVGRNEDALSALARLDSSLMLNPQFYFSKSSALSSLGRNSEAVETLKDFVKNNPNNARGLCLLSQKLVAAEQFEEGVQYSRRLLQIEPNHTHAYLDMMTSYLGMERPDEALKCLDLLLDQDDEASASYMGWAAELLWKNGRYHDAMRAIDSALAINPKASELVAVQAEIFIAIKDYSRANAILDQAELLGMNDVQLDNLRIELFTKEHGVAGLGLVAKHLKEKPETDLHVLDWYSAVWELLHSALKKDGPLSFSIAIRDILNEVSVEVIEDDLAESIVKLCFHDPGVGIFSSPDWKRAFIVIRESLSSLESCRMTLDFLSAASDYAVNRIGEELLRLPLEQRNLILSSFGDAG